MAQVRLYQDIDGCLNAEYNARVWRDKDNLDDHNAGYQRGNVRPEYDDSGRLGQPRSVAYRMEWNDRLVAALNTLDVEFVWTTTWREDARKVGELMGLLHDPQRVLHPLDGITSFPSIDWKWSAIVQEQTHDPSPFIAIDDEWWNVSPFKLTALESLGGMVISPEPNLGVTPKHISMMREYIATH